MSHSTVSFGYQNIPLNQKKPRIEALFSNVASKYDIMNDVMSFGQHRLWKNAFIHQLNVRAGKKYLDVAGGTGDIALRIADKLGTGENITILDLTYDMLIAGQERDHPYNNQIKRICGDAENLPFENNSFDYYTISYGIRNVTNIPQTLKEAYRVLRPGGKFMCLEFSHIELSALRKIYDAYSFHILPKMGALIAQDQDSYQYLAESIRRFPKQKKFLKMIIDTGFKHAHYHELSGGITSIHAGFKAFT